MPAATTFLDYRRSPLVATSRDRTSTFSLDTDRTSFQLALNWARGGYQVDPDSVRAEEWVNAFNYEYARPRDNNSFAISTALVEHPLQSEMHLARITFQAPDVRDDNRPLNVTLVLDASGSMSSGNRVEIARAAAESIRNSLGSNDRISVVQFSDDVIGRYTVESRQPDDRAVTNSISNLRPNNSTNVQAGLNLGVRLADRMRYDRPDSYNYVILMSDGVANVDATDPFAILRTADDRQSNNPLRLITIGVGIENYNDYLLEQLAQNGNGWYRYLDDVDQARATFSRENWTTISRLPLPIRLGPRWSGTLRRLIRGGLSDTRTGVTYRPGLRGEPEGVCGDSLRHCDNRLLRNTADSQGRSPEWTAHQAGRRARQVGHSHQWGNEAAGCGDSGLQRHPI